MSDDDTKLSRRDLLKAASMAGLGLTTSAIGSVRDDDDREGAAWNRRGPVQGTMIGVKFDPRDVVRLGIVGVGLRGTSTLGEFLAVDKVVVNAVCDVVKEKCLRAGQMIEKAGQKTPAIYCNGERDFEGEHWSFHDATSEPHPSPQPEIWVGGSSARAIRRARELGNVWHPSRGSDADHVRRIKEQYPELRVVPRTSPERVDAMLDSGAEGAVVQFPDRSAMRDFARKHR